MNRTEYILGLDNVAEISNLMGRDAKDAGNYSEKDAMGLLSDWGSHSMRGATSSSSPLWGSDATCLQAMSCILQC